MNRQQPNPQTASRPVRKFDLGGIGVAIWNNTKDSGNGPRVFCTLTISCRRYKDDKGQWRNSPLRPEDLGAVMFLLSKAQEYLVASPLPSADQEDVPEDAVP